MTRGCGNQTWFRTKLRGRCRGRRTAALARSTRRYLVAGFSGASAAALGVFLPVYVVVVVLGPSYKRWAKNPQINAFVRGVTAAATGAIAGAVVVLARRSVFDVYTGLICVATLLVLFQWKVPEPILIGCAAVAGLVLHHAYNCSVA